MNLFAISGLLIGITSTIETLIMFIKGSRKIHYLWGIFCISVMLWGFGGYKIATTLDSALAILWWRVTYIGVIFIPVFLIHFIYTFLEISRRWVVRLFYIIGTLFLVTNFIDGIFINKVRLVFNQFYYLSSPTIIYNLFVVFFFGSVIYTLFKLWQAYRSATGIRRAQLKYMFFSLFIGFGGGGTSFFLVYNINFYPFLNLTVSLGILAVAYAIVTKKLFDIKVVLTSFFVGLIAILISIDVLVFTERLSFRIVKGGVLVAFLFFGYLLVKSVLKEIKYREEIARAYEVEKHAHKELKRLDEAKNQFIMASQHHLRTPLTSMQGYLDLIFGGTYGKVSPEIKKTLLKFQASTSRLIKIVNEFLDISQFQLGKRVISLQPDIQIEPILKEIIEELQFEVKAKGLYLKIEKPEEIPKIKTDPEKLKVALFNIVDNGIKYTSKGGVTIKIKTTDSNIQIAVKDTGVGIPKEEVKTLFSGLFERGEIAKKLYTTGRGIGLFITTQIIKAHQGKIWAESEGEGKGSTFYIELPKG